MKSNFKLKHTFWPFDFWSLFDVYCFFYYSQQLRGGGSLISCPNFNLNLTHNYTHTYTIVGIDDSLKLKLLAQLCKAKHVKELTNKIICFGILTFLSSLMKFCIIFFSEIWIVSNMSRWVIWWVFDQNNVILRCKTAGMSVQEKKNRI